MLLLSRAGKKSRDKCWWIKSCRWKLITDELRLFFYMYSPGRSHSPEECSPLIWVCFDLSVSDWQERAERTAEGPRNGRVSLFILCFQITSMSTKLSTTHVKSDHQTASNSVCLVWERPCRSVLSCITNSSSSKLCGNVTQRHCRRACLWRLHCRWIDITFGATYREF